MIYSLEQIATKSYTFIKNMGPREAWVYCGLSTKYAEQNIPNLGPLKLGALDPSPSCSAVDPLQHAVSLHVVAWP